MDDDGSVSWNRMVTLAFVIGSIVVLLLITIFVFLLPILRQ